MGIYGALSTAVTGLKAQSFALENISGNIANSQTTGYKRIETSFEDMVPDGTPATQNAGAVTASSVATNNVAGDVSASQTTTNMAINGTGFFAVQQKTGETDGKSVFGGATLYTRRGDFDVDKEGYLVNGAGNYLDGLPIDPSTGNVSGSVPNVIKISNALLPALATTSINYQLNLPQQPQDVSYQSTVPGSDLLKPADVLPGGAPIPAVLTGTANLNNDTAATDVGTTDLSTTLGGIATGQEITITIGGVTKTIGFNTTGTPGAGEDGAVNVTTGTGASLVTAINAAFGTNVASLDSTTNALKLTAGNTTGTITVADEAGATAGALAALGNSASAGPTSSVISGLTNSLSVKIGTGSAVAINLSGVKDSASFLTAVQTAVGANGTASIDPTTGELKIVASNTTNAITLSGTDTNAAGFATAVADPGVTPGSGPMTTIDANHGDTFVNESISGGAITGYAPNGSPVSVQFRWAKTDSTTTGGQDTWNLFYLSNSGATGTQPMWTNVGVNYTFGNNGSLSPPVATTPINNLTVNGVSLGNISLVHGTNGVTQFADPNGTTSVTTLTQNGYAAGKYTSVAIDDSGKVVASYSNGVQLKVAQVVIANFNGADALQRLDGGTFAETSESGSPVFSDSPSIAGSSLEGSNTDISTEFSTLIVTQQAYAAGTKIVTTANDMLQQALNMIR